MLRVENVSVDIDGKEIVKNASLKIDPGEIVALIGPNGSGKSTLARAIMGDPSLKVKGKIYLKDEDITNLSPEERFRRGIFLSFQSPPEVDGISVEVFLEEVFPELSWGRVEKYWKEFRLGDIEREVNVGFSGGERKKFELLQLILADPEMAILDEIDSGLDLDSVRMVAAILRELRDRGKGILVITHYDRMFNELSPDRVYLMIEGKIMIEGGREILQKVSKKGYGEMYGDPGP